MSHWIDFKKLRAALSFKEVLAHYKVELKSKGREQYSAYCPLPNHKGQGSGRTLSVNLNRSIWKCFGCEAGGNVIDFAVLMEGLNADNAADVRKTALMLAEKFGIQEAQQPSPRKSGSPQPSHASSSKGEAIDGRGDSQKRLDKPRVVNAPLDFTLKNLDTGHPYFKDQGLTAETIAHFGLGYCARGMLAGRIAIPLHDASGHLVGYAGRVIDDKAVNPENPKYRFPEDRERKGVLHLFRPSLLLYNSHGQKTPLDDLMVTRDLEMVWWLHQAGLPHAVALMANECSNEQVGFIAASMTAKGRIWIVTDDTELGEAWTEKALLQISRKCLVRRVKLPADNRVAKGSPEELATKFQI